MDPRILLSPLDPFEFSRILWSKKIQKNPRIRFSPPSFNIQWQSWSIVFSQDVIRIVEEVIISTFFFEFFKRLSSWRQILFSISLGLWQCDYRSYVKKEIREVWNVIVIRCFETIIVYVCVKLSMFFSVLYIDENLFSVIFVFVFQSPIPFFSRLDSWFIIIQLRILFTYSLL